MTNSELTQAALSAGLEDDGTAAAALDAIREESGCSLLAAILKVARVHKATCDSRDIKAAHDELGPHSPVRVALRRAIVNECLDLPLGAEALVVVVTGDRVPRASRTIPSHHTAPTDPHIVSVGALWVKRVASQLHLALALEARRPRRRRSS